MPTVKNAFDAYLKHLSKTGQKSTIPLIRSAVLRFTVPGWGGPQPQGERSTASEIEAGLKFLEQLDCSELEKALKVQEFFFEEREIPKQRRRQPRAYLKPTFRKLLVEPEVFFKTPDNFPWEALAKDCSGRFLIKIIKRTRLLTPMKVSKTKKI